MYQSISKRITSLRFILIILIIFIHNNSNTIENIFLVQNIKILFSEIIARSAVPLFFLISGYLFFFKSESYSVIIKKKVRTLFIPYMLWNSFSILLFWLGQNVPGLSRFFTDEDNMVASYSLFQWLDAFLGLNSGGYPIVYPLWFIRDLMLMVLLFPFIQWIIDKVPRLVFGGIVLLWSLDIRFLLISSEAVLFFFLGYYAVKYQFKIEKVDRISYKLLLLVYTGLLLGELCLLHQEMNIQWIHKCNILLGVILLIKVSKLLICKTKLYEQLNVLSGYAFFVYALHEPILTLIRKIWGKIFNLESALAQLLQYFGAVFFILVFSMLLGIVVKKITPKFYSLITGGRM